MYRPKINKETIHQLSLDVMKIIRKKIKEELNGQGKDKKNPKGFGRNSSNNSDKNINKLE